MLPEAADPIVLNAAMNLCLEFGPQWREPIVGRLRRAHPELSAEEEAALATYVAEKRDWAHRLVIACQRNASSEEETRRQIIDGCPWLDVPTLERLWSQGCYYAMRG